MTMYDKKLGITSTDNANFGTHVFETVKYIDSRKRCSVVINQRERYIRVARAFRGRRPYKKSMSASPRASE